jgi:hypothetical protein
VFVVFLLGDLFYFPTSARDTPIRVGWCCNESSAILKQNAMLESKTFTKNKQKARIGLVIRVPIFDPRIPLDPTKKFEVQLNKVRMTSQSNCG